MVDDDESALMGEKILAERVRHVNALSCQAAIGLILAGIFYAVFMKGAGEGRRAFVFVALQSIVSAVYFGRWLFTRLTACSSLFSVLFDTSPSG